MAQYSNGEYYRARITSTTRDDRGEALFVCKFEEDGVVERLLADRLRRVR